MQKPKLFRPDRGGLGTHTKVFDGRKNIKDMYDEQWAKYRLKFLAVNSRCYACGTTAKIVDHLLPHKGDIKLFKKLDNHIPLCTSCHNRVTALFDKMHSSGTPITAKLMWLAEQRTKNDLTFRVKVLPKYESY